MIHQPIYCINLKERTDRKKHAQKEFRKIDIKENDVIFLDLYRDKKGGIYGCYDSHMKVWNDFYKNHLDQELCIVFEDEFEATENSILYFKKAISFIEKNKDKVDILFLHDSFIEYNDNYDKKDISNTYFTRGYGFLTHVYIVTRKYIKSILDKNDNHLPKPNGIHFDIDINMNANGILYSENIFFCKDTEFIFNIGKNIATKFKLLLQNDKKTKKCIMLIHYLYVKNEIDIDFLKNIITDYI